MPPMPDGIGYKLASEKQSNDIILCAGRMMLYKLAVSCNSGPDTLRCVLKPRPMLFCQKKIKSETIAIIPFSTDVGLIKTAKKTPVKITCTITLGGRTTTKVMYAYKWEPHGAVEDGENSSPDAMPVFWHALDCGSNAYEGNAPVQLKVVEKTVTFPMQFFGSDMLKKANTKVDMEFVVPVMTNETACSAGEAVFGRYTELDETLKKS